MAGFPCIDISRAGCRQGLTGQASYIHKAELSHKTQQILTQSLPLQSSGLVKHVFRLLQRAQEAARPVPWVLLENVRPGLSSQQPLSPGLGLRGSS